jgi:hypothetical protein
MENCLGVCGGNNTVAVNDTGNLSEDTQINIIGNLPAGKGDLQNDQDPDNDPLTAALVVVLSMAPEQFFRSALICRSATTAPGETWSRISAALRQGRCRLPHGLSLAQLRTKYANKR